MASFACSTVTATRNGPGLAAYKLPQIYRDLTPRSETDLVTPATPATYGCIATSRPPDDVTLAENLVHEFQRVTLCGLLDMVPLAETGQQKVYAPWRQDPRPAGGLLQSIYAHLGIVRFRQAEQHAQRLVCARPEV